MKEHEQIIHNYREDIRAWLGDEIADKSYIDYNKGWYYSEFAQKFPDGSCGVISSFRGAYAYRKKEIVARTQEFLKRARGGQK